jgi:FAD/FMN-containing dehydrogenase
MVLIEFEGMSEGGLRESVIGALHRALETREAETVLLAENASQARDFWRIREDISAGHRPEGAQVNHDVSVPVSQTPTFLALANPAMEAICPGARIVAFGHMGDGNFHYTVVQPEGADPARFPGASLSQRVHEIAVALGGSISAEHGIGVARTSDLVRFKDAESMSLMRAVKQAIDPKRIMNPRTLLP